MPGRDTKTRYQGVFARHQERCKVTKTGDRHDCNCTPGYYGAAWDREANKPQKTPRVKHLSEARNARADLLEALGKGEFVSRPGRR